MNWTPEQVLSLALHEHQARSSQALASPLKWSGLARCNMQHWGFYPVKHKDDLRVRVQLAPLRFGCDCQGPTFPCSHALGLALLVLDRPELFEEARAPDWLSWPQWARPQRTSKVDPARQAHLLAGLDALELWLEDLLAEGLESLRSKPRSAFKQMSDLLVDARATRPARMLGRWPLVLRQADWLEPILKDMGSLHLLIQGFKHLEDLRPEVQADLQAAVGWTPPLKRDGLKDRWHVLGQQVMQHAKHKEQRIWLAGEATGRYALLRRQLHHREARDTRFLVGTAFEGKLNFYASQVPLRAELADEIELEQTQALSWGESSLPHALSGYASALACKPWLAHYPLRLRGVRATETEAGWQLLDEAGYGLPLASNAPYLWHLRALSHQTLSIFGLWDGSIYHPLSYTQGQKQRDLKSLRGRR